MTKNRQQAFGDLNKKSQDADPNAQSGEGANEAEGKDENEGKDEGDGGSQGSKGKPEKTYTDADVDKIVEKRIARAKTEWEKDLQKEKDALTEAQKLEKMNDQQKAEYKAKKLQEEIDELKREKSFNEQMGVARKMLKESEIKLDDELLSMLVSSEAEKTNKAITTFIPLFQKAVTEAVQESLKRNPPKADKGQGQVKSDGAKAADKYNQRFQAGGN